MHRCWVLSILITSRDLRGTCFVQGIAPSHNTQRKKGHRCPDVLLEEWTLFWQPPLCPADCHPLALYSGQDWTVCPLPRTSLVRAPGMSWHFPTQKLAFVHPSVEPSREFQWPHPKPSCLKRWRGWSLSFNNLLGDGGGRDAGESTSETILAQKGQNRDQTSMSFHFCLHFHCSSVLRTDGMGKEAQASCLCCPCWWLSNAHQTLEWDVFLVSLSAKVPSTIVGNWEQHSQHSLFRGQEKLFSCWRGQAWVWTTQRQAGSDGQQMLRILLPASVPSTACLCRVWVTV